MSGNTEKEQELARMRGRRKSQYDEILPPKIFERKRSSLISNLNEDTSGSRTVSRNSSYQSGANTPSMTAKNGRKKPDPSKSFSRKNSFKVSDSDPAIKTKTLSVKSEEGML